MSELKRTPLYDAHVALGATMVDFGGWDMPIQYPEGILSEISEKLALVLGGNRGNFLGKRRGGFCVHHELLLVRRVNY